MKRFIGDAVMSTPLLNAVEAEYRPLHIICAPAVAQVLENPDVPREFLPLDTKRKPWEVLKAAMALRRRRFGVALLINHSFRSALTARLAGIPKRVGHPTEGRNWLLTDSVAYDESEYEAWSELALAGLLGIDAERVRPTLPVRESEIVAGKTLLEGAVVGVQPGARFASKMLPQEMIAAVCNRIQESGREVAFLGAKEEKQSAESLTPLLKRKPIDLVGVTDVRGSLGALANLSLMMGADTGLMHMAAAVATPTLTIFGPTPAQKWGHYYDPHKVLLAPEGDMSKVDSELVARMAFEILERQ